MAKVLKQNVILRKSPADVPEGFLAGEPLPEWVQERLANATHLFEDGPAEKVVTIPKPADQDPEVEQESAETTENVSTFKSEDNEPADDEDDEPVVPKRNASKAIWLKFAEEAKKDGYPVVIPEKADRDAIIAALVEAEVIPAD